MSADDVIVKTWSDQLCDLLAPHINNGFIRLYADAKRMNPAQTCKMFQLCLSRIPSLPASVLQEDYNTLLLTGCQAQWLNQLLLGIFATYAKLHLISQGAVRQVQIYRRDLGVPDNITFLHRCYIEAARSVWAQPFLYSDKFDVIKRHENLGQAQITIRESIRRSIVRQIPFDHLYQKYMANGFPALNSPSMPSGPAPPISSAASASAASSGNMSRPSSPGLEGYLEAEGESMGGELLPTDNLDLDLAIRLPPSAGRPKASWSKPKAGNSKEELHAANWEPGPLTADNIDYVQTLLDNQTSYSTHVKSQLIDKLMKTPKLVPLAHPIPSRSATPSSTFNLTLQSELVAEESKPVDSSMETPSDFSPPFTPQPSLASAEKPLEVPESPVFPQSPQTSAPTGGEETLTPIPWGASIISEDDFSKVSPAVPILPPPINPPSPPEVEAVELVEASGQSHSPLPGPPSPSSPSLSSPSRSSPSPSMTPFSSEAEDEAEGSDNETIFLDLWSAGQDAPVVPILIPLSAEDDIPAEPLGPDPSPSPSPTFLSAHSSPLSSLFDDEELVNDLAQLPNTWIQKILRQLQEKLGPAAVPTMPGEALTMPISPRSFSSSSPDGKNKRFIPVIRKTPPASPLPVPTLVTVVPEPAIAPSSEVAIDPAIVAVLAEAPESSTISLPPAPAQDNVGLPLEAAAPPSEASKGHLQQLKKRIRFLLQRQRSVKLPLAEELR